MMQLPTESRGGWRRGRQAVLVVIAGIAALVLCLPGTSDAAGRPQFQITSTSSYSWSGRLKVKIAVEGTARVETAPWNVCGGVPPGDSLKYTPPLFPGDSGFYSLVDASGKTVAVCGGPPTVGGFEPGSVRAIPEHLAIAVGYPEVSCKSFPEEALTFQLSPEVTRVEATPGTAASEESHFSSEVEVPEEYGVSPTVCLTETSSYEIPNQECARYFKPEFCAKESGSFVASIQSFKPGYVPTRTPGCNKAKAAVRKAHTEVRTAKTPRSKARVRNRLEARLYPRELGECG
jgi:hypothetical protein